MSTLSVSETGASRAALGPSIAELQSLATLGIEAVPTLVISTDTLEKIAAHNDLHQKIHIIWQEFHAEPNNGTEKLADKLHHLFARVELPTAVSHSLLKHVHHHFGNSYVCIYAADSGFTHSAYSQENVKGDANITTSILEVWRARVTDLCSQSRNAFSDSLVIPCELVIQELLDAQASGVAYTKHPLTEDKNQIVIRSIHGIQSLQDRYEKTDTFTVDSRTWNIISTKKSTQTLGYHRALDSFKAYGLSATKQNQLSLHRQTVSELAHIVRSIKLAFPDHKKIWWYLVEDKLLILGLRSFDVVGAKTSVAHTKTKTKILLELTGQAVDNTHSSYQVDGIGQLTGDTLLTTLGIHPMHMLKGKHRATYKVGITAAISKTLGDMVYPSCLYRASSFTSQTLSTLHHGQSWEPEEDNPFIGFRGGSKVFLQPDVFSFELEILSDLLNTAKNTLGLTVPWVRGPEELQFLTELVHKYQLFEHKQFKLWWELSTPENLLNLKAYKLDRVAGLIIDTATIQSLLMGVDPSNEQLRGQYPVTAAATELIFDTLKSHLAELDRELPVYVKLREFNSTTLHQVVAAQFDGVIVRPSLVPRTTQQLHHIETTPLNRFTPGRQAG